MSLSPTPSRPSELQTRDVAKRWCVLAEKRLGYLTELFDSGRWRRFHNEVDFLENIHEAKSAVERWRAMANGEFITPSVAAAAPSQPVSTEFAMMQPAPEMVALDVARVLPHLVAVNEAVAVTPVAETNDRAENTVRAASINDWPVPVDLDEVRDRYPILRAAM